MEVTYKFTLDIVLCLDVSGDNRVPLEGLKNAVEGLGNAMAERYIQEEHIPLRDIRLCLVTFRDFSPGLSETPLECSPFFSLHYNERELIEYLDGMKAEGGGDIPESSLEALAKCFTLPFNERKRDRTAIIFITNALPQPYGTGKEHELYPKDIPSSYDEVLAHIGTFGSNVRILILGPDCPEYRAIESASRYANFITVEPGEMVGLSKPGIVKLVERVAFDAD